MAVIGSWGELDWPHRTSNLVYLRNGFLSTIEHIGGPVLEELRDGPFQLYMKQEMEQLREMGIQWEEIVYHTIFKSRFLPPEARAFRQSLEDWACRHNLQASWCLEVAYRTLQTWATSANLEPLYFSGPGGGGTRPSDAPPPAPGLPEYLPLYERRSGFLKRVSDLAGQAITDNPLLASGSAPQRRAFIATIVQKAAQYCEAVEQHYLARGYERCEEKDELIRNMMWTVRFQVLGESFSEIAKTAAKDATEAAASTVQRPVTEMLKKLKLPKRSDAAPGRPSGSKNKDAGVLRGLGRG